MKKNLKLNKGKLRDLQPSELEAVKGATGITMGTGPVSSWCKKQENASKKAKRSGESG